MTFILSQTDKFFISKDFGKTQAKDKYMVTIIRKSNEESIASPNNRPVQKAIGWQIQVRSKGWSPPTDMYEIEDAYILRVEIAGMREADLTVSVEGKFLIVSGSRSDIQERGAYHQMEIRCGKFTSAVVLPGPVNLENARAEYEDGFFVVVLPKENPRNEVQEK